VYIVVVFGSVLLRDGSSCSFPLLITAVTRSTSPVAEHDATSVPDLCVGAQGRELAT
jgi:hypothetical protein